MSTEDASDSKHMVQISNVLDNIRNMIGSLNLSIIEKTARLITDADIVVSFGNGGSHAIASHFACDIMLKPGPLFITIGDNVSNHTAYANDYSFEESAALAIERIESAHSGKRKMLIVLSTSGESKNIMRAAKTASSLGWTVVAMLGRHLHRLEPYADLIISVDGNKAGRIEAVHDAICHAIAEVVPIMTESR